MPRFFVPHGAVAGGRVSIAGDDAAHLARSLRVVPGEVVTVVEEGGLEHGVVVDTVSAGEVSGTVAWSRAVTGEPALGVHVVQALPKSGMDEAVEALAEVGARAVWPVITARTVARPDARRAETRVHRWRLIAREAAGLAGRGAPPAIEPVRSLAEAVPLLVVHRLLVCSPGASRPLSGVIAGAGESIAVCIGPEGGFSAAELRALADAGGELVHLGPRVLRARLAGAVATALLLASAGDLGAAPEPGAHNAVGPGTPSRPGPRR